MMQNQQNEEENPNRLRAWEVFFRPRKIKTKEEKEKYERYLLDALMSYLKDPDWLSFAVKNDVNPVPFLVMKFQLDQTLQSKIARRMLKTWYTFWDEIFDVNTVYMELSKKKEMLPVLADTKTVDWLNVRIPEIYSFLWDYTWLGIMDEKYVLMKNQMLEQIGLYNKKKKEEETT